MSVEKPNREVDRLHPRLREHWKVFYLTMRAMGDPVFLVEGLRSHERQDWLYEQGRSRPGRIVTWARAGQSSHNPKADGFGYALDFAFVKKPHWSEEHPWALAGAIAKHIGMKWGGDWPEKRCDKPHLYIEEPLTREV